MSPELEKEIIVACTGVFFSALFAGFPSVLLFWWTWRRDQERLRVEKYIVLVNALGGKAVVEKDDCGLPTIGVSIRNLSRFPVRLSAAGFDVDGKIFQLERSDDNELGELARGASTIVLAASASDRQIIHQALERVALARHISTDDLWFTRRVSALAALETGRQFDSYPLRRRLLRLYFRASLPFRRAWNRLKRRGRTPFR
jgi:hypothetical protein